MNISSDPADFAAQMRSISGEITALLAVRQTLHALVRDVEAALDHVNETLAALPPPPAPAQLRLPLGVTH